ncbi:nitrite reductase large subunit NirB [Ferrimonas marina]|uniref:Nitrite reductase (NADH) large subunit n=1 Tax=Ferrimonas marina TaxID=299255 RepID=A0A1M5ZB80_9GAMM|nr:nitrite reductase large subunit NirB [Ferrimonas marina]SHI21163.1 nitrite reductase (NADH) large subunit [Ferrimonas marina]
MNKTRIVVVGNGMVGHHLLEQLTDQPGLELITFSEEPRLAYDRVQLTQFFATGDANSLALTSEDQYQQAGVHYHLNARISGIDPTGKTVITEQGDILSYDKLVLATGSYPFIPPIPGREQPHIHPYRTIEDLEAIQASARSSRSGVVIGGGLLGLEAANALKTLGLDTHVVEFAPRLMAVQLDDGGGALLRHKIEALGVSVHTGKNTQTIARGEQQRYCLQFADGTTLESDMLVFSAGIRPQDALARDAGLTIGERGGIVINDHCQTSDPDIYAIGECALWQGRIFGLVAPGYQMAKVAAQHLQGEPASFVGADMSTKLKLLGVEVASIGDAHGQSEGSLSYSFNDEATGVYKKLVVNEAGDRLLGAVLVGDSSDYGSWLQLCLNNLPLPCAPEQLLIPLAEGAAPAALGSDLLPDSAQICSCHDVSKGDLCSAIQDGCHDLGELKACTKAGTGCGGCSQLVGQVFNSTLESLGMEVNNHLCEHFAYSRAELFDIVRIKQLKQFDQVLADCGQGQHGCDICKPAIGSMLASLWNEHVLATPHVGLQDTNDTFLANMQKDGTYSVVPRVPGGEITPDKLIVLGQIAKQYNLYTKITGGQRIDLFGAQLHQLPLIWRQLVDAGFETGHAYGKALRTVKSCVGSTWCRYGVQDSMTMAITVEERYRGIRSPHKIKMAVSGCTRECAEAQSKDFGVIATENGWNLYVCGNGGMRPRHADLFATDLDDRTLLQYIDRIMMFYVRTADRLQRTSVWMESLEGGLDYLKAVVIEDKLGICDELEAQMAHLVDSYQCEWKATLEDPEKLKRFSHFINSEQADDGVRFVPERGQIRPARPDELAIPVMEVNS